MKRNLIIVVNPGSTSTKIAVYRGRKSLVCETIAHPKKQLSRFNDTAEEYQFRRDAVFEFLAEREVALDRCAAVIGRGGLTKPVAGGVYRVGPRMLRDLGGNRWGKHPSNFGAPLAAELAQAAGVPAFVADPPIVDELSPLARYAGHPLFERRSLFHALSQRAAARRAARQLRIAYEKHNFIVVHLGGGISVGAHQQGRVVDVNNALEGDGPFSPERSGAVPPGDLVRLCFSGRYSQEQVQKMLTGEGGLYAYLGTNDCRRIEQMIRRGNAKAQQAYHAMAYQIAKSIGAAAAVLSGRVQAVVFAGALANSKMLLGIIRRYAGFIAPFLVYPAMEEMSALALAAHAALNGKIPVQEYE
jgi:butyrate kinase